jgi:outer membrane receptor protein involved in Fe transport
MSRPLSGFLMTTTALLAAQVAHAQQTPPPADPPPPAEASSEDEIVVLGRNIPEPMRTNAEVANYLQLEDLARTGDSTAAEALTRVTGLSLAQGRFVYVRGLGERYSSALLNGSPLPSPEPLQRVVPLDLFPSSILGGVSVQKTYSANFPGEFGGGVIALQTLGLPSESFLSVSIGTGLNTETTFKDGLTYYGSQTDSLGFDDATRKLPIGLQQLAPNRRLNGLPANQIAAVARSFENSNVNVLQSIDVVPNGSLSFSGGRTFDGDGYDFGIVAVAGYDRSWQVRTGSQDYGRIDNGALVTLTDQDFTSTQEDVTLNALVGVGLRANDHQVRWTNLYVRNTSKEARTKDGFTVNLGSNVREDATEWFERELLMTQFVGEHAFGNFDIDWRASYAETARNVPYETVVQYGRDGTGRLRHNPSSDFNQTRFSELQDSSIGLGADVAFAPENVPLVADAEFRGGFSYTRNDRDSWSRSFRFRSLPDAGAAIQFQRIDHIRSDFYLSDGTVFLEEVTPLDGTAAYKGLLIVNGAYAQAEAEVLPTIRAAVGVRYEDGIQRVRTVNYLNDAAFRLSSKTIEEQYVLPSATVTWNFAEDMQLRFGASQTIARPQFRELSSQQFLDPEDDRTNIGNESLVDSELLNLDARYEWFFDRDQYFTVAAYYKDIKKPIEAYIFEPSQFTIWRSYINAPGAILYGAEIEGKKYFDVNFGIPFFDKKRWLAQANYSYTTSEVQVGAGDTVAPPGLGGALRPASDFIIDGSELQGQSEHLANIQFGWEDEDAGSQATVLVNYASERITARGNLSSGQPDFIQDPGVRLDFVYRKTLTLMGRELGFTFEARNLTGEDFEEFQEQSGRVDVNRYDIGQSYSINLSSKF